ncbi:MAG: SDR family oxidoreductase [Cytophagales bacterium]|nr:SDR family oxidoreductase [Rhizobacter sp.]
MNLAPNELDPSRQLHPETLGQVPGRGRLQGRRVLVIGAGQRVIPEDNPPIGNGRAISVLFAREGASVVCVDINAEAVQATVDQVTKEGGKAFAEVADVSDVSLIAPLVQRAAQQLGGLDGLVLNVGISHGLPLSKITPATWDKEYAVNLRSHLFFSQAALEVMEPGGSIVLMSSLASLRAASRNPAYESSKAAQVALARSIAVAGESKGIRGNAVLPGLMDTPMGRDASRRRPGRAAAVPFGRQGTGWEVAYATLYLISHESSYVNGHALLIDGGLSIGVVRSTA